MSKKEIFHNGNVNGGQTKTIEYPTAIPNNEIWVIDLIGACDINEGDSKSTVYILKFGNEILKVISCTGNTFESDKKIQITGDGTKKLNAQIINNSTYDKACPMWMEGHKL
jgi:hypothetical protein